MNRINGPLDVYLQDPVVRHSWKFTLRQPAQLLIVEIACGLVFREFRVKEEKVTEGDNIVTKYSVVDDNDQLLSTVTRVNDQHYRLDSPSNLIEAAEQPVSVPA